MLLSVDVQGFQYSPSPVVPFHFSRLGCFPVHLVLVCPGVDCNSILGVMLLHCILVLTQSLLKGSTCLSNVNTFTILAWYFINDTTKNGIAVHSWANQHQVDWEAAKTREVEGNYWRRRVLEALHIHREQHTSNLDCGLAINPCWLPLLNTPSPP